MALKLGKRKRVTREELQQPSRTPSAASASDQSEDEDLQAIFRRAFEAKFTPLETEPVRPGAEAAESEDEDLEEDSGWSGLSSEDEDQVEVVEHADAWQTSDKASKAEMRKFMVYFALHYI